MASSRPELMPSPVAGWTAWEASPHKTTQSVGLSFGSFTVTPPYAAQSYHFRYAASFRSLVDIVEKLATYALSCATRSSVAASAVRKSGASSGSPSEMLHTPFGCLHT